MITYVQDCILRKRPNPNGLNITNLVRVVTDQLGRTGSPPYKTNSFAKELSARFTILLITSIAFQGHFYLRHLPILVSNMNIMMF